MAFAVLSKKMAEPVTDAEIKALSSAGMRDHLLHVLKVIASETDEGKSFDRKNLFLDFASSLQAKSYADLCIERLKRDIPVGVLKTLLQDNGAEHSDHSRLELALGVVAFFCHPYCASERGTVENRNRVLRRFLPKGTDFCNASPENEHLTG